MRHTLIILLALTRSACSSDGTQMSDCTTSPCPQEVAVIPLEPSRNIDILFMIDNSGAMAEEQAALVASFDRFIDVLSGTEGLPNLHIGVVSSDVGAGSYGSDKCEGSGDNGALQNTPAGNCSPPDDAYIVDNGNGDGSRTRNYQGALADTFSCIAQLGLSGCTFEQPLESLKRALEPSNSGNAGFLRDDAWLVLVLLTNEDDCSASDSELYNPNESGPLGPLASFRCFEFGVVCDEDQPRTLGVKTGCQSRENSTYLRPVSEYASFFKGLKSDPSDVIVAGITGNRAPVTVVRDNDGNPLLSNSCVSVDSEATPAVRIASFLSSFPARNVSTTICNDDLSDAITVIGELVTTALGSPCLQGTISTPLDCQVHDVRNHGQSNEMRSELSECDNASPTNQPCYVIAEDLAQCSTTQSGLMVEVHRTEAPPNGTSIVVTCKSEG